MFIQTEETPNPETLKFIPGESVLGEIPSVYYKDLNTAKVSPIATALFGIDGVCGVYLASDFITVTLKDKSWENTKTEVLSCISNHYVSGLPFINDEDINRFEEIKELSDDTSIKINQIIEEKVRPAVARDGGDIIFNKFEDGVVYISMRGSCDGCPATFAMPTGPLKLSRPKLPVKVRIKKLNVLVIQKTVWLAP